MAPNYESWSREELIARLTDLERRLKATPHYHHPRRGPSPGSTGRRPFHFKDHPVRKIAIKFCYSGWEYNGLAYQVDPTPLPTVEEVLFQAFAKARLVDADAGLDGCGWERCGRTDVGVSAAGQVVSLWVRSARPVDDASPPNPNAAGPSTAAGLGTAPDPSLDVADPLAPPAELPSIDLADEPPSNVSAPPPCTHSKELHYVSILNRVLPPTIRVFAWSPVSPDFSARFNCTHRHYKYFFTAHGLDIALMRSAARALVGQHDFRNLCKLDPAKQITDFRRRITTADVSPVSDSVDPGSGSDGANAVYVLDLVGNAFLYHQVRHIVAILFLVGAGLEPPSIVSALTNVDGSERFPATTGGGGGDADDAGTPLPVVDRKPEYQMADALPLVLWDCAFPDSDVRWQTGDGDGDGDGDDDGSKRARAGGEDGLYHHLHSVHQRSLVHTVLEAHFLAAAARYHPPPPRHVPSASSLTGLTTSLPTNKEPPVFGVPLGGGTYRRGTRYVPVLARKRLDHVDVVNARWRAGKGSRKTRKVDETRNDTAAD